MPESREIIEIWREIEKMKERIETLEKTTVRTEYYQDIGTFWKETGDMK